MKKVLFLFVCYSFFSVNAIACELDFYVSSSEKNPIVFTIISPDNKYQNTSIPVVPGHSTSFIGLTCQSYNIYAQDITLNKFSVRSPYGDYVYLYNPLQLTGNLSLFFPKDFKLDSLGTFKH
jgi:hypothetical protein